MKTDVLLDPWLVSQPSRASDIKEVEVFVDALQAWSSAIGRSDVLVLRTDDCVSALFEDKCYPFPHQLGDFLRAHNIDYVDVETLTTVVTWIISRSSLLQEITGTLEVVCCDERSVVVIPGLVLQRLTPTVARAYQQALLTVAVWRAIHQDSRLIVGSAPQDAGHDSWQEVEVSCDALVEGLDEYTEPSLTLCNQTIPVCFGHNDLLAQQGPWELWSRACSEQCVRDAIDAKIADLKRNGVGNSPLPYRIGPRFLESLKVRPFATRPEYALPLIEACARIALLIPKQELKPFRVTSATQAPQYIRERDGARALRTHLSKSGAAYRLMLWQRNDGSVEFANVGEKRELMIEE